MANRVSLNHTYKLWCDLPPLFLSFGSVLICKFVWCTTTTTTIIIRRRRSCDWKCARSTSTREWANETKQIDAAKSNVVDGNFLISQQRRRRLQIEKIVQVHGRSNGSGNAFVFPFWCSTSIYKSLGCTTAPSIWYRNARAFNKSKLIQLPDRIGFLPLNLLPFSIHVASALLL